MTHETIEIDLSGLTDAEYIAIENEATRQGISFDDALKQAIQSVSRRLQKQAENKPSTRLFGFQNAH